MCQNYNAQYGGLFTSSRYKNPHCKRCSSDVEIGERYLNLFCTEGMV